MHLLIVNNFHCKFYHHIQSRINARKLSTWKTFFFVTKKLASPNNTTERLP